MGFHIDAMQEATKDDEFSGHYRALAKVARWPWAQWWYNRKADKLEQSADIWRGLEWRKQRAFENHEWLIEHEKHCPGRKQDE